MASPHQVLGVDSDADRETVERRYRELVKEVHPDAGGSAEEFKRVRRAYRAIVGDGGAGTTPGSAPDGDAGTTGPGSTRGTGPTGPGSSRSGTGRRRAGSSGSATGSDSAGGQRGSADGGDGTGSGGSKSDRQRRASAAGAAGTAGGTGGAGGRSSRRYTAAGREKRPSGAAGSGGSAATSTGSGTGRAKDRESGRSEGSTGVPRRWFLYGSSAIFAGAAYALRDQTLSDILNDDGGGEPPDRSAASGLPLQDSASREVSPEALFDVGFETPTAATVEFTVQGADTRDWINVYTREEYERVAENWDGEGRFDPGDPLETVLTDEGYVADLPEAGTYVILVKLWAGPPDDPREARTVEVSYQATA